LTYALNESGHMVFIDHVDNGLACRCRCPKCGEALEAKNGGPIRHHHFAHKPGSTCTGAYETALHRLCKEIISREKTVMLPRYIIPDKQHDDYEFDLSEYEKFEAHKAHFTDVEIEQRNDLSFIQPDCVGVTAEGQRLLIEICVTHAVDADKRATIRKFELDCVEIVIPRNAPLDKEWLTEFLTEKSDSRRWVNYPSGEKKLRINKEQSQKAAIMKYREEHKGYRGILSDRCYKCTVHQEIQEQEFQRFINDYKGKLLPWAEQIAKLTPEAAFEQSIYIRHTGYNRFSFVHFNNWDYYIYPKNTENITTDYLQRCDVTYRFLNELYHRSEWYVNHKDHCYCKYFGKSFEYCGQWYTFCSKPL